MNSQSGPASPLADLGQARSARAARWLIVALEVVVSASAVYGGIGLMVNGMGMPREWLTGTPFDSWVLPGVLLLALIAVPMAVAAAARLAGHGHADRVSMVAGAVLVGWIGGQILILRHFFFLQPVLLVIGVLILLLAVYSGHSAMSPTRDSQAPTSRSSTRSLDNPT